MCAFEFAFACMRRRVILCMCTRVCDFERQQAALDHTISGLMERVTVRIGATTYESV